MHAPASWRLASRSTRRCTACLRCLDALSAPAHPSKPRPSVCCAPVSVSSALQHVAAARAEAGYRVATLSMVQIDPTQALEKKSQAAGREIDTCRSRLAQRPTRAPRRRCVAACVTHPSHARPSSPAASFCTQRRSSLRRATPPSHCHPARPHAPTGQVSLRLFGGGGLIANTPARRRHVGSVRTCANHAANPCASVRLRILRRQRPEPTRTWHDRSQPHTTRTATSGQHTSVCRGRGGGGGGGGRKGGGEGGGAGPAGRDQRWSVRTRRPRWTAASHDPHAAPSCWHATRAPAWRASLHARLRPRAHLSQASSACHTAHRATNTAQLWTPASTDTRGCHGQALVRRHHRWRRGKHPRTDAMKLFEMRRATAWSWCIIALSSRTSSTMRCSAASSCLPSCPASSREASSRLASVGGWCGCESWATKRESRSQPGPAPGAAAAWPFFCAERISCCTTPSCCSCCWCCCCCAP